MNLTLYTSNRFFKPLLVATLLTVLIAVPSINGWAQEDCKQAMNAAVAAASNQEPITVSMKDLQKRPEDYYGKEVTIAGEINRSFTPNIFTIRARNEDILVISNAPRPEVVLPLNASAKRVRLTGVVQPYDRGQLECAYGPLHLEGAEGRSFTKNAVLIVNKEQPAKETETAKLEKPLPAVPTPETRAPVPAMPPTVPTPEVATPEAPKPEPSKSLPRTAGELPLLALIGLVALSGAWVKSALE